MENNPLLSCHSHNPTLALQNMEQIMESEGQTLLVKLGVPFKTLFIISNPNYVPNLYFSQSSLPVKLLLTCEWRNLLFSSRTSPLMKEHAFGGLVISSVWRCETWCQFLLLGLFELSDLLQISKNAEICFSRMRRKPQQLHSDTLKKRANDSVEQVRDIFLLLDYKQLFH